MGCETNFINTNRLAVIELQHLRRS